ncbi:flagellar hook-length control protein FliK [uncultured Thermanaerothrix sp.]|uniref:flagellar hook-length control protein FliK n=1 Tax=uncultured Thermanaerothrix sp. TaxID=1195149 RepID=UPI00260BF425|nr:flagellar hook-length control protein FliK [uncultured Thermanaerothrix sp.]
MNLELFLGRQMNAPPLEQPPCALASMKGKGISTRNEAGGTAPSFQSLWAEQRDRSVEPQARLQPEPAGEDEALTSTPAQTSGSSEVSEAETASPLLTLFPFLIEPSQFNLPLALPDGAVRDPEESVFQDLPAGIPEMGAEWVALNLPETGDSQSPTLGTGIVSSTTLPSNVGPLTTGSSRDARALAQGRSEVKPSGILSTSGLQVRETDQPQEARATDPSLTPTDGVAIRSVSFEAVVERALGTVKATLSTVQNHPIHQAMRAVDLMVRFDQSNLSLQLYPESLGRIEIRIAHGAEGTRVWMVADHPQTERLLQAGLNDLRQSLAQSGIQLADVTVGQQYAQENLFRQPHGSPTRLRLPFDTRSPEGDHEKAVSLRVREADSYVDYRI